MGNSRGADFDRKFDTWKWSDSAVAPRSYEFEVRYRAPENIAKKAPVFYIESQDPFFEIEDGDLSKLRKKLDDAVREAFTRSWSRHFLVKYQTDAGPAGASIDLSVFVYEIASDAVMSGGVHRRVRDDDFDPAKGERDGWEYALKTGGEKEIVASNQHYGDEHSRYAILPATVENRAALLSLIAGVTKIGEKLDALLEPKKIRETMKTLAFNRLLPAGK